MKRNDTAGFYKEEDFSHLLSDHGHLFLKHLFDRYYAELCKLSFKYVGRSDIAEDLVQDVFINIWNKRFSLNCKGNIKPYLTKSVVNTSINYIQSKFARKIIVEKRNIKDEDSIYSQHDEMAGKELSQLLKVAIEQLPDKCRTIFLMSRFSNLSYKEIAGELNISTKTVEAQIRIALQKIYQFLSKYGYFGLLLLLKTKIFVLF